MNPWLVVLIVVVIGFVAIVSLAYLISLVVSFAADTYSKKFFGGYQKSIEDMLPGKNCGQCGCPDCAAFADCLMRQELVLSKCPYADPEKEALIDELVEKLKKEIEDPQPIKKRRSFFDRIISKR